MIEVNLIPLGILAFLSVLSLGILMEKHGKPQSNYSFGYSFFAFVLNWSLIIWMIW